MKETKNYGLSVKAKLLNLAHRVNQPYQVLLTRYIQERFLYRLSTSEYRNKFFLKGGALLYAFDRLQIPVYMKPGFPVIWSHRLCWQN